MFYFKQHRIFVQWLKILLKSTCQKLNGWTACKIGVNQTSVKLTPINPKSIFFSLIDVGVASNSRKSERLFLKEIRILIFYRKKSAKIVKIKRNDS